MYTGVGFRAKFDKANSGSPGAANFSRELKKINPPFIFSKNLTFVNFFDKIKSQRKITKEAPYEPTSIYT